MSEHTAIVTGNWVDANGMPKSRDRMCVRVTRIDETYHFDVEDSGRGSVTMHGSEGSGKFTTRAGIPLVLHLKEERDAMRYRLVQGVAQIAIGMIYGLPP